MFVSIYGGEIMYDNIIFQEVKGNHTYITYQLSYLTDKKKYLDYLMPILRREYGLTDSFEKKIESLSDDRKQMFREIYPQYITPNPESNPLKSSKTHLKPTRSKASELIAKDCLEVNKRASFAGRISLDEDDPDLQKRGVDNFGFVFKEEAGDVSLENIVVCEVKASEEAKNPPKVVEKNEDSLYKSLLSLSKLDNRFMKALAKAFDKLELEKYTSLIADVMLDIEANDCLDETRKKLLIVPFLFRTLETYNDSDFGKFYADPSEFEGTTITYYIVVVDVPLAQFADDLYACVRGEENE